MKGINTFQSIETGLFIIVHKSSGKSSSRSAVVEDALPSVASGIKLIPELQAQIRTISYNASTPLGKTAVYLLRRPRNSDLFCS